ncbi:MAG: hypothetical protein J2O48_07270, partial [Solirubrobacterales bacterium]|nr:hypothetical protein [Solirubrobacterales bacterium]
MLEPEPANAAADDALGAFRQTAAQTNGNNQDDVLLAMTRLMTAVSVPDNSSPADRRKMVLAGISAESHCTCRESSVLLATRANGNLQPHEGTALDKHLESCEHCQGLAKKTDEAGEAFRNELKPDEPAAAPEAEKHGVSNTTKALGALGVVAVAAGATAVVLATNGGSHPHGTNAA